MKKQFTEAEKVISLEKENAKLREEKQKLLDELAYFRRAFFGRKSERYLPEDPDQLKLDFQGMEELPEEKEVREEPQTITYTRVHKKATPAKPVRMALDPGLRREVTVIEPENIPEGSKCIGEEITERLEYTPGEFWVKRLERKKYALPREAGVIIAGLPTQVLPRSNAGASLLAHLLVSKYQDHLPFYRQIEIFKRQGTHLAASTVNGWFTETIKLLTPLYETLRKEVLSSGYIQIDESTIPVVDKDKPGATVKAYHWIVHAPIRKLLFFHYDKGSRAQRVAVSILKDFKGALQSDGYGAYTIYENKQDVLLLGCWAHVRRKFENALKNDTVRADYALKQIRMLYDLEYDMKQDGLSVEEIKQRREEKAYPIIKSFEKWLDENYRKVLPQSLIGKAIAYAYTIYPRLGRYVLDGRYNIDNNLAENGVRPLALGRKNYLFCGNHDAAEHTAIIYSLLGTCKLNNVNPTEWLTDVLNRINEQKVNELSELLPMNWAEKMTQV
ncbi:MAG: IS66 family transposase [Candidatus Symbiothrix sp.]|jgi:transposase|nr:IS66 family transposase [Candidatus Symbiothrix sp.]